MAAIYDIQVKQQLDEYDTALKGYPISAARRKEKVKRLRLFLQSLSKDFSSYAICNFKKLGQKYTSTNNIVFANLRQTHYEDELGTQWRMSFLQVSKNVVKIYRLYQAQFVDESYYRRKIKENTNNTMNTNKKTIRLTESDLRHMVKEAIKETLNELDARTYASYANKRRKQAQNASNFSNQMNYTNKAEQGEEAARNAWNKKYGYSEDNRNGNTYGYNQRQMINTTDNPYQVHSQSMSKNDYEDRPYTSNVSNNIQGTSDAMRTAQQMANNSGTYIKGKGWQ